MKPDTLIAGALMFVLFVFIVVHGQLRSYIALLSGAGASPQPAPAPLTGAAQPQTGGVDLGPVPQIPVVSLPGIGVTPMVPGPFGAN